MDGGARIAEVSSSFKFTTSNREVCSETMPNPISLLCAPAVIKKFIPGGKLRSPRRFFKTEFDVRHHSPGSGSTRRCSIAKFEHLVVMTDVLRVIAGNGVRSVL
jgi:hypothetical protein